MQSLREKNIAILCNALAGSGSAVLCAENICTRLSDKNIRHTQFKDTWPGDFSLYTDIFIVGGDGTLNYFINRYPGMRLPLVIFKGGTGNDVYWLLYGNSTLDEQLETALNSSPKPLDIGKCNDRYFINGVGIGFEGEVAKALTGKKKLPGKTSFLITVLKKIVTYRSKRYTIQSAERSLSGRRLLVDISNGRRAGGGFHIAPEARADDGLLDVIIADALTPLQRVRYLPVIEKGKHLHLSFIHHFRTRKISIEGDDLLQYHLDGEYFVAKRLNIEIIPAAVTFRF